MGKMKEEFMKMQTEGYFDNMSDAEYQDWLRNEAPFVSQKCNGGCDECQCEGESATQEEVQTNHDAWWNSLTDEQKQQMYDSKEALFKLTIEELNWRDDIGGPNNTYGV